MSTTDDRNIDPIEEITRIAQDFLQLPLRGFKESYRSIKPGKIIYDSKWCRLNIIWGGWDYLGGNSIQIRYGRFHALDEKATMIWNGEECRCWHRVEHALHFLDKRAPDETANLNYDKRATDETANLNYSHPITKPFYEKEFREKFYRQQPEWMAQMHTTIWQHYGQQLFELFDLNQPDLWQRYQQFLKEIYDFEGRIPEVEPPLDKVC
jgi:hypothetical protein